MDSSEQVVGSFNKLWIAGDIDAAIHFVTGDAVHRLYISEELLPFGGETRGRSAIKAARTMMRKQFEYLLSRPYNYRVVGEAVHHRVEFM